MHPYSSSGSIPIMLYKRSYGIELIRRIFANIGQFFLQRHGLIISCFCCTHHLPKSHRPLAAPPVIRATTLLSLEARPVAHFREPSCLAKEAYTKSNAKSQKAAYFINFLASLFTIHCTGILEFVTQAQAARAELLTRV
jgi:hypothetical protein